MRTVGTFIGYPISRVPMTYARGSSTFPLRRSERFHTSTNFDFTRREGAHTTFKGLYSLVARSRYSQMRLATILGFGLLPLVPLGSCRQASFAVQADAQAGTQAPLDSQASVSKRKRTHRYLPFLKDTDTCHSSNRPLHSHYRPSSGPTLYARVIV